MPENKTRKARFLCSILENRFNSQPLDWPTLVKAMNKARYRVVGRGGKRRASRRVLSKRRRHVNYVGVGEFQVVEGTYNVFLNYKKPSLGISEGRGRQHKSNLDLVDMFS